MHHFSAVHPGNFSKTPKTTATWTRRRPVTLLAVGQLGHPKHALAVFTRTNRPIFPASPAHRKNNPQSVAFFSHRGFLRTLQQRKNPRPRPESQRQTMKSLFNLFFTHPFHGP